MVGRLKNLAVGDAISVKQTRQDVLQFPLIGSYGDIWKRFHRNGVGRLGDTGMEIWMVLCENICYILNLLKRKEGDLPKRQTALG